MIVSYKLGQKHYPVPYARKKLIAYIVLVVLLYAVHRGAVYFLDNHWFNLGLATGVFLFFTWFVVQIERKELVKMPVIGKWIKGRG